MQCQPDTRTIEERLTAIEKAVDRIDTMLEGLCEWVNKTDKEMSSGREAVYIPKARE